MASWNEEVERAREEARKARAEAMRLRDEARELERRLRDEARRGRHRALHDARFGPHLFGDAGESPGDSRDGGRSEQAFSLADVANVSIAQTAGNLTVRVCAEGETPGVVTASLKTPPQLSVRRDGDRLIVEVHLAKGWLFRRRQGPTTVVRLSPGLSNVRANLGYGELQVRDIASETMKFDVGAGTITAYATSGELHADVGAGKLSLSAHRGLASCSTGTGDILLDIAAVAPGDYKVDVGMGRAEVRLPAGEQVHVTASSGIGKSRLEYPSGPESAPTRLKLNTGIGEVIVKARDVSQPEGPPPVTAKPQRSSRGGPQPRRHEAEELRVLQMLEQGRITSQDAADLIAALQGAAPPVSESDEEAPPPDA